ncbi:NAD-binding protein [Streptomyces scabiei]|uniref:NAD-binding protein n=1 Tax=Streptomyces scabiei TaxID=1930 RepID=UPI002990267B|nr:NAD-binding protein [Streptomyces scabiei]MDW8803432.1 NAD-binding protein [Streptomyces scabiei]
MTGPVRRGRGRGHRREAQAQASDFTSATALAATSEAVAFGPGAGPDPAVMVQVLDASGGRSGASADTFPDEVFTGRCAPGFGTVLMTKDVRLRLDEARPLSGARTMGR